MHVMDGVWRLDPVVREYHLGGEIRTDESPPLGSRHWCRSMKGLMEVGLKSSGLSLTLDLEERKVEEGCVESPEMTTVRKGREQI